MNNASQIENSQHEGPTKIMDQNHLAAGRKAKLNEKWRENRGILARNKNSQNA